MLEKNHYLVLLTLLLIAVCARLYLVVTPNVITNDGILYIETAKKIASGDFKKIKEVSFFNLYPVVIVGFQKIFNDWELSGRMVSVIFGALGVIPLFFLITRLISHDIALVTTFFYVINHHIVEYSSDVLREPLFFFLFLFALWTGVEGIVSNRKSTYFFLFLSGVFTGLSMSVRIEGVISIFIIFIWGAWLCKTGNLKGKTLFLRLFSFIFFLIVIFLPPLYFIKERLGWWEFGLLGDKIFYLLMNFHKIDIETLIKNDGYFLNKAPIQIKGFIDISLRQRYVAYACEVIYKLIKPLNIVFFFLAIFGILKRKSFPFFKGEVFFFIWFLFAFASCFIYVAKIQYLGTRHGLLMAIPVLLWSAIGFFEFVDKTKRLLERIKTFSFFLKFFYLFVLFFIIAFNSYFILTSYRNDKIELKKAGIYLKQMGFKGKNIATIPQLSRIVFYAEATPVLIRADMPAEALKSFFNETKVEYIIIDRNLFENFFPEGNLVLALPNLKKVDVPAFNVFEKYFLEVYKFN